MPLTEPASSTGARRALTTLTDDLDVPAAVADALGGGPDAGEAATLLLDVLKLHQD